MGIPFRSRDRFGAPFGHDPPWPPHPGPCATGRPSPAAAGRRQLSAVGRRCNGLQIALAAASTWPLPYTGRWWPPPAVHSVGRRRTGLQIYLAVTPHGRCHTLASLYSGRRLLHGRFSGHHYLTALLAVGNWPLCWWPPQYLDRPSAVWLPTVIKREAVPFSAKFVSKLINWRNSQCELYK
jgi:hypothetical protein